MANVEEQLRRLAAEGDWPQFHHGQGTGDLTGDGLPEILINEGWLTRDRPKIPFPLGLRAFR